MTPSEGLSITKYDLLYEQRMTRAETQNETTVLVIKDITDMLKEIKAEMKSDFRWLFSIILASNAGLFALMAHGFKWF